MDAPRPTRICRLHARVVGLLHCGGSAASGGRMAQKAGRYPRQESHGTAHSWVGEVGQQNVQAGRFQAVEIGTPLSSVAFFIWKCNLAVRALCCSGRVANYSAVRSTQEQIYLFLKLINSAFYKRTNP